MNYQTQVAKVLDNISETSNVLDLENRFFRITEQLREKLTQGKLIELRLNCGVESVDTKNLESNREILNMPIENMYFNNIFQKVTAFFNLQNFNNLDIVLKKIHRALRKHGEFSGCYLPRNSQLRYALNEIMSQEPFSQMASLKDIDWYSYDKDGLILLGKLAGFSHVEVLEDEYVVEMDFNEFSNYLEERNPTLVEILGEHLDKFKFEFFDVLKELANYNNRKIKLIHRILTFTMKK